MLQSKDLVKKTIIISLIVQIITGLISLRGFFLKIPENDRILKDILTLETIVQFIEMLFYIWVASSVMSLSLITPRRYIDWIITTPTMLLSTIMFMRYQEQVELEKQDSEPIKTETFINSNKNLILEMFLYNFLMLLFGYLGEVKILPKNISIFIGFIFFFKSFNLIYSNYAKKSVLGTKLFIFLLVVWGLYGIAAMFNNETKNTMYNILDIIAKNFYGLYIYYKIYQISI